MFRQTGFAGFTKSDAVFSTCCTNLFTRDLTGIYVLIDTVGNIHTTAAALSNGIFARSVALD